MGKKSSKDTCKLQGMQLSTKLLLRWGSDHSISDYIFDCEHTNRKKCWAGEKSLAGDIAASDGEAEEDLVEEAKDDLVEGIKEYLEDRFIISPQGKLIIPSDKSF